MMEEAEKEAGKGKGKGKFIDYRKSLKGNSGFQLPWPDKPWLLGIICLLSVV